MKRKFISQKGMRDFRRSEDIANSQARRATEAGFDVEIYTTRYACGCEDPDCAGGAGVRTKSNAWVDRQALSAFLHPEFV